MMARGRALFERLIPVGIVSSLVLLIAGISIPALVISPPEGLIPEIIRAFDGDLAAQDESYSIVGTVGKLFELGSYFLACVIFVFSIIVPIAKLALLGLAFGAARAGRAAGGVLGLVEKTAKYSMLDVMIFALLLVTLKSLPGGVRVTLGPGVLLFATSILLSMALPYGIRAMSLRASTVTGP